MRSCISALLPGFALLAVACSADPTPTSDQGVGVDIPRGFPTPRIPADNPISAEKVELGRHLFYDKRLSGNQAASCSTCHQQDKAFTDGRPTAVGATGQAHARNSSGLTNSVYNSTLTWANPLLTELEDQLLVPVFGEEPIEMGATGHEAEILERLELDSGYQELFAAAFPEDPDPVDWANVVRALSSFVRTLISGDSPFDRFVYQGDGSALDASERRGLELFFSERLECHHCHGGFNFTESSVHASSAFESARFHNTGLYNLDGHGAYPPGNTGVYEVSGRPEDMGRFRAPTLRNVALTAPYMHDGSVGSLEEVIRIYEAGGRSIASGPYAGDGSQSPLKSGFVSGFSLSDSERADLLKFLESLTDRQFIEDPRFSDPFEQGNQ